VSVSPTLNVSQWIGQIKGASAHHINHRMANRGLLERQTGYGVVSFGTKGLPRVVAYIRNQKEHHACGSTPERLERVERVEARERAEPDFSGIAGEPAVKRLA
jgi:putative transposase